MASATDVTVCIPWREQPHRLGAFKRVWEFWAEQGFEIVTGDSDSERFNLAAARNDAVRSANTEIVIVTDADTIAEPYVIRDAIATARARPVVVYPFGRYVYLGEIDPETPNLDAVKPERIFTASVGGIFVTSKKTYWRVGGHDERFTQWGFEDNAFHAAAETLAAVERLSGTVWAFGHEAERDMSLQNPGHARMKLYNFARNRPEIMLELLK